MDRNSLIGANVISLSICYQHLAARLNHVFKPLQLNMTQVSILTHFMRHPGTETTIGDLAARMEMNQPATTKAVAALVSQGWISKQADEKDARISRVKVTPAGLAQLQLAYQTSAPVIDAAYQNLSDTDLASLLQLLEKIKLALH